MKSREKRTTTEPGLGQVAGDPRHTAIRERVPHDLRQGKANERPASGPPISRPPLNARHTRAIESVQTAAEEPPPSTKPATIQTIAEVDRVQRTGRIERSEGGLEGERVERVDRVDRATPTLREEGRDSREMDGKPASRAPVSRPIEGRPVRPSRAPGPKPVSSGPPRRSQTTRPSAPGAASVPPPRSVRPAKSVRASIRVDDVGAAVKSGNDAVGGVGRQVPKIVRTKGEIAEAPIDHRAGFLLAHIDGVTSVQGLVDIAGMPENEVHAILDRLRRLGIVIIR